MITGCYSPSKTFVRRLNKQLGFIRDVTDEQRFIEVAVETTMARRHINCITHPPTLSHPLPSTRNINHLCHLYGKRIIHWKMWVINVGESCLPQQHTKSTVCHLLLLLLSCAKSHMLSSTGMLHPSTCELAVDCDRPRSNSLTKLAHWHTAFWEQRSCPIHTTGTDQPNHLQLFRLMLASGSKHKQAEAIVATMVACTMLTAALTIALCTHPVMFVFGIYDNVAE